MKNAVRQLVNFCPSAHTFFRKPIVVTSFVVFLIAAFVAAGESRAQRSSSIVIHDTTTAGNGGGNATKSLRDAIKSEIERQNPCVETMDDQDLRDAMQDERDRALLEGGDSQATLTDIGNRVGSSLVMTVKSMPGGGGSTVYNVAVLDTKKASAVAREMGSDPGQIAQNLVRSLAPYLANNCKPHWTGTINYVSVFNETKTSTDQGATHATRRNVKRVNTQTSNMTSTIKATLLKPTDESVNSPKARVMQRVQSTFSKNSDSSGEERCREPGKNPYFKGFSEKYGETTTMLGQGTDTMPVFISIDSDGAYSIKVTAPAGVLYGKSETSRSLSGCKSDVPETTKDAQSLPEGRIEATSFDAEGKVDPKNKDVLSGSQTSPDGRTKITWSLRLVKPKGK